MDGLGGVLFKFPFRVPAYYALILRSLTVLEGLALQADKNYKLLGKAYPYMAKRLLIDPAPELRSVFLSSARRQCLQSGYVSLVDLQGDSATSSASCQERSSHARPGCCAGAEMSSSWPCSQALFRFLRKSSPSGSHFQVT